MPAPASPSASIGRARAGMHREDDRQLARRPQPALRRSRPGAPARRRAPGRCSVTTRYVAVARGRARPAAPTPRVAVAHGDERVDHRVADVVDRALVALPSRSRLSRASGEWMNSRSEIASVTSRLISSGMVRSKLRRPASTCPTGTPSFAATSAARERRVHVAGHEHEVGLAPRAATGSRRSITRAVCCACEPEPTPRKWSGSPTPSSLEEDLRHRVVVVLAGVDEHVLERRRAPARARARSARSS